MNFPLQPSQSYYDDENDQLNDLSGDLGAKDDGKIIVLVSGEGDRFEAPAAMVNRMFGMVRCMNETDDSDSDDDSYSSSDSDSSPKELVFPKVRGSALASVVEYCVHHHSVAPMPPVRTPFDSCEIETILGGGPHVHWYARFVRRRGLEELRELVAAANYLDVRPLLDLCVLGVSAEIATGRRNEEEVRALFGIRGGAAFSAGEASSSGRRSWCEWYMSATPPKSSSLSTEPRP